MNSEQAIALAESTKEELAALKSLIRKTYSSANQQVTNKSIRNEAKRIAEQWTIQLAPLPLVSSVLGSEIGDLTFQFERLYIAGDRAAQRSTYDDIFTGIGQVFSAPQILALKRARVSTPTASGLLKKADSPLVIADKVPTAFVGHSFAEQDVPVAKAVVDMLAAIGVFVVTGEKPRAERISDKVKELIESQEIFVGLFTRRDKLHRRNEWTTTSWVLEEKAYAVAKTKRLILLREDGVGSIGGMHGDHEYVSFSRDDVGSLLVRLTQMFAIKTSGLR